jgi:hypothetical protein
MKNIFFGSLTILLLLTSCKDKVYNKYLANSPIYTSFEAFRGSIKLETPHALTTKGGIYIKDNYLFVTEPNNGVHIIDNSNPSTPNNIGFLRITGNTGIIIKGNYLYANALIDLVVIDISVISNPKEVARLEDIFPNSIPLPSYNPDYPIATIDKKLGIVTDFEIKEVKQDIDDNYSTCNGCEFTTTQNETALFTDGASTNVQSQGMSGSITKMTLIDNYIYIMEQYNLVPIDISNPLNPKNTNRVSIWRNVETLFAAQNHIFMGTTTGMLIYETSNPDNPTERSVINHIDACDPVIVQGDYAYVTIRSGNTCAGTFNQLDIIDITNLDSPTIKESFQFTNPHGLGIDGTSLFICDGSDGLKILDATNPLTCGDQLISTFSDIQATDIIPFNSTAIVIGDAGIYQYDYTDINNLTLLSTINF